MTDPDGVGPWHLRLLASVALGLLVGAAYWVVLPWVVTRYFAG